MLSVIDRRYVSAISTTRGMGEGLLSIARTRIATDERAALC
ncbi:MAG: hypothetical protein OXC07_08475 [Kistimonas sp.]|nr:hypothetical protein [Kistimonas sp.]